LAQGHFYLWEVNSNDRSNKTNQKTSVTQASGS